MPVLDSFSTWQIKVLNHTDGKIIYKSISVLNGMQHCPQWTNRKSGRLKGKRPWYKQSAIYDSLHIYHLMLYNIILPTSKVLLHFCSDLNRTSSSTHTFKIVMQRTLLYGAKLMWRAYFMLRWNRVNSAIGESSAAQFIFLLWHLYPPKNKQNTSLSNVCKRTSSVLLTSPSSSDSYFLCISFLFLASFVFSLPYIFCSCNLFPLSPCLISRIHPPPVCALTPALPSFFFYNIPL